jgi:hypothetical protein
MLASLLAMVPTSAGAQPDLQPFFDNDARSAAAPPPPHLGALDEAVLRLCGGWGSRPSAEEFRDLLDDPALQPDVASIRDRLGGAVLGERLPLEAFKNELTEVWFAEEGFRHIFCGEPHGENLGGLHFAGRYLEMQQQRWGGLIENCPREEIAPPIYTFGMLYQAPDGGFAKSCPKGYALDLDAADLLVETTRALNELLETDGGDGMCLHRVEAGEADYFAVFVMENGAIGTFYPDASPRCEGGGAPSSCMCDG